MASNGKQGKRVLAKKVTSFNMYLDQANQIHAIMEATGIDKDAQVLRELLDEALASRRRKIAQQLTLPEAAPTPQYLQTLETIQTLLLKLIEQGEKARGVRGICLELLQETLAEARAGRKRPTVIGVESFAAHNGEEIQKLDADIEHARFYAYGLAVEIAKRQNATEEDCQQPID